MSTPLPKESSSALREALVAATGGGRDVAATAVRLSSWLTERYGEDAAVTDLRPPAGAGIANETWLVDAAVAGRVERLVFRVRPSKVTLFPDPDFVGLFRLLAALSSSGLVRVPEPVWLEEDDAVLGSSFLVMRMLDGRVPVTEPPYAAVGWVAEASTDQRRTMWTSAVTELARIHVVPAATVSFLGWPQFGDTGEDQQLGYWQHYRRWSGVPAIDVIDELGSWVAANRPHEPGTFLSWGDARLGNMIFGADFRLQAVLDWDQMSLASPRHDLAWWLLFEEMNTTYKGVARPEGWGSREETVELWQDGTRLEAGDLAWYEAFTTWKLALITLHMMCLAGTPDRGAASAGFIAELGRTAAGLGG
jgi:aminoglycoside phosphotransferase (APT) family kinase protein